MGGTHPKLKCLYLPAQSGKTRKIEELIDEYKTINECLGDGDINILISANNKLLVRQTEVRMKNNLGTESEEGANDAVIKGRVFSWISGDTNCNISPRELKLSILEEEIEMIVVCSHSKRLKYLVDMINLLITSKLFNNRKINIWIDEADKSIKLWQKYETIIEIPAIYQVTLVSATFTSIFAKYGCLQVMGFLKTHPECYRRLKDSVKIEENFVTPHAIDYVKHVILKYSNTLVRPGVCAFIPGDMRKASHDAIADFLYDLGFVVMVLNGDRREILVPGTEKIDLDCYLTPGAPEEFNVQLAKLYTENNWARFPFAITGFYCVQRGVTFQCLPKYGVHDGFIFNYGVIPPITSKPDAYQTMARLFGNIGESPHYKPIEIYTTFAMFSKVEKQEEVAVNLPRIVEEQGLVSVNKKDIKDAQNFVSDSILDSIWTPFYSEFTNLEDANKFMHANGGRGKALKSIEKTMQDGFYKSSTSKEAIVLDYHLVKQEIAGWKKTSNLDSRNVKDVSARMYICYKDTKDPTSEVYICRGVKRK